MARKILLADDSVTAQNMGRKILSDAGYDVVTVNNGSAALKRVAEQRPDLIVLDVYMPGYSGLEVCQRLKDSPETKGIPILLTVGKLEPFKPEEARRVRAEAFIVKPFEASELLSALTKLEDQVVPGSSDGSRFSGLVSGVEHFDEPGPESEGAGDPDTGWKNRLRFPAKKKKKEEPETQSEEEFLAGTVHEFRRGRSKAQHPSAAPEKAAPPPPVVPEIPRDITPEELDALSSLAAKLDGDAAAENTGVTAKAAVEAPAIASPASSEPTREFEVTAPAAADPSAARPESVAEAAVVPAENTRPAAESSAEPPPTIAEAKQPETLPAKVETAAEKVPEPEDRKEEPSLPAPVVAEAAPKENPAVTETPDASTVGQTTGAAASAEAPAKVEEKKAEEAPVEQKPKAEEAPKATKGVPTGSSTADGAQVEPESPAPSVEELEEALRLLTPSAADSASTPSPETLVASGAVPAEEAAHSASEAPRWMAEAVAVSPEEAARSLEAEMFEMLAEHEAGEEAAAAGASTAEKVPEEACADTIATIPEVASPSSSESVEAGEAAQSSKTEVEGVTPTEEPAPVTFADAVRPADEASVSAETKTEPAAPAAAEEVGLPVAETTAVSTSEATPGGEEDMSKQRGKSSWHQIRAGAPPANDPLEAAKQAEPAGEEAPKAMAAAAAADPGAIANIVDSVLADLRPKIVEEIAKKLAGK